jgi:hypothetical protein
MPFPSRRAVAPRVYLIDAGVGAVVSWLILTPLAVYYVIRAGMALGQRGLSNASTMNNGNGPSCATSTSLDSLGGTEAIEHHQQCQPDRFGEPRVVVGRFAAVLGHHQLGQPVVVRRLGPGPYGSVDVNADPAHHGGPPAAEVVDRGRVMARQLQPCLLHRILGVRPRSEDPVGHRHRQSTSQQSASKEP